MFDWTIVFGRASQGNLLTRPGQLAGVSLLGSASRQQHHLISTIVYHNIREDQLLQPTLSHEDLRSIRCCSIRGSKVAIKRKADEGDFERRVRQATGDLRHEADKHLQHANEANQRAVVAVSAAARPETHQGRPMSVHDEKAFRRACEELLLLPGVREQCVFVAKKLHAAAVAAIMGRRHDQVLFHVFGPHERQK